MLIFQSFALYLHKNWSWSLSCDAKSMFKMNRQVKTFFTCFIIINSSFIAVTFENAVDIQQLNISSSNSPTRRWISQLFDEAKKTFQMDSLTNSKCRMDYISYLSHLHNQSIWAVKSKFWRFKYRSIAQSVSMLIIHVYILYHAEIDRRHFFSVGRMGVNWKLWNFKLMSCA